MGNDDTNIFDSILGMELADSTVSVNGNVVGYTTTTSGTGVPIDTTRYTNSTGYIQWDPIIQTGSYTTGTIAEQMFTPERATIVIDKEECSGTLIDSVIALEAIIDELQKIIKDQSMAIKRLEQKLNIDGDSEENMDILTEGL